MTSTTRIAAPDIARALGLTGVVIMNYHVYLNRSEAIRPLHPSFWQDIFNPVTGFLTTRFATLFVLVAGMSLSLLTASTSHHPRHVQMTILRRGFFLLVLGYCLEWIWHGTIIFYYGAYFLLAAFFVFRTTRTLLITALFAIFCGAALQAWRASQAFNKNATTWLAPSSMSTPRNFLIRVFVSYTHPVLPWFAFVCIGIILGRHLGSIALWRKRIAALSLLIVGSAYLLSHLVHRFVDPTTQTGVAIRTLASTNPFSRGILFSITTCGVAVFIFLLVSAWSEKQSLVRVRAVLQLIGQTTLTLYVAHALFYNGIVNRAHWVKPTGLDTALVLAVVFLAMASIFSLLYTHFIGQGPIERLYRLIGG
ncbi:MAG: DUF418 domain-containing protein [Ilumatobacteraceae bacterium]|nr:DUF418 domain-containing protein [Ilumatobacteraceae bacterium]